MRLLATLSTFCRTTASNSASYAILKRLRMREITASAYRLNINRGVKRVNHTMALMLSMVVDKRQHDWNVHLPHVEFAYNRAVSAAAGLSLHRP